MPTHSFRQLWRPPIISRLAAEDRCHPNGLVIDVQQANAIVARGLSIPHSPRWYRGRLWVCNSGSGEFDWIDLASGRFEPLSFCPGYLRGVAFHGDYALLDTSKHRHNRTFSGLPSAMPCIGSTSRGRWRSSMT